MNVFSLLLSDPVAVYSLVGLLILFGICGFYVFYFIKKIHDNG